MQVLRLTICIQLVYVRGNQTAYGRSRDIYYKAFLFCAMFLRKIAASLWRSKLLQSQKGLMFQKICSVRYYLHKALRFGNRRESNRHTVWCVTRKKRESSITGRMQQYQTRCLYFVSVQMLLLLYAESEEDDFSSWRIVPMFMKKWFKTCIPHRAKDEMELFRDITYNPILPYFHILPGAVFISLCCWMCIHKASTICLHLLICKSMWIKVSAKWRSVNVKCKALLECTC